MLGDLKVASFTRSARREQIVAAAIDTIAELGYGHASLARIASRAGTSKGVVGYHFAGKDDLIRQVVEHILSAGAAYMQSQMLDEPSGREALRAYITSSLAFMRDHHNYVVTIVEIARNARDEEGAYFYSQTQIDEMIQTLAQVLAMFQAMEDLRADFDPLFMAIAIRASIDAASSRLVRDTDFDVDHYAEDIANLFDLATRNPDEIPAEGGADPDHG